LRETDWRDGSRARRAHRRGVTPACV
jgi:hypothetical protein